jgi:hypothetical protein
LAGTSAKKEKATMRHVFFALFEDAREADEAVSELGVLDAGKERCHVEVHKGGLDSETLPLGETRGQKRLVQGALMGGFFGAVVGGAVLGPQHFLLVVGPTGAALVCGVLGLVIGGLGGLLTGVSGPDTKLEGMEALMRRGAIVVAVDTEGRPVREQAEQIVRRHGALVQHHALI